MQCSKCHEPGTEGAPRVGDRAAWTPRLKNGLDATVRSAINGHGGMPARGGMADLSAAEVRNAVIYMFNPGTAAKRAAHSWSAGASRPASPATRAATWPISRPLRAQLSAKSVWYPPSR